MLRAPALRLTCLIACCLLFGCSSDGGERDQTAGDADSDQTAGDADRTDVVTDTDHGSSDAPSNVGGEPDGSNGSDADGSNGGSEDAPPSGECTSNSDWEMDGDGDHTLIAPRTQREPTLDGDLSDDTYRAAPVLEFDDETGESDNAMGVRAYWDKNYLYVAIEVDDDDLQTSDANLFQRDGVEVFFDTRYDRHDAMIWDDYQWAVSADGDLATRFAEHTSLDIPAEQATDTSGDGYTVELAIPWTPIGLTPAEGLRIGILLANNDVDAGEGIKHWSWGDVVPYKQPDQWSRIRLAPASCEESADIVEPDDQSHTLVGGGEGYWDIYRPEEADVVVETLDELEQGLANATSGDVVYVDDDAEIYTGDTENVDIPAGVTLASGRGHDGSEGALIHTDVFGVRPVFEMRRDSRMTGLRLRGPHVGHLVPPDCNSNSCVRHGCGSVGDYNAVGVNIYEADVELDNNVLSGWPRSAVYTGTEPHIHHNEMFGNALVGLGYGVTGTGGNPLLEFNWFNENRHSIAEDGTGGYVARYNVQGPDTVAHVFDMHDPGGTSTVLHNNTVEMQRNVCGDPDLSIALKNSPEDVNEIKRNWFYRSSTDTILIEDAQRTEMEDNHFGTDEPPLHLGGPR